ncbi:MAG TPA: flagellar hook-basal body complex protein FliE [Phenylobacterium sp.]
MNPAPIESIAAGVQVYGPPLQAAIPSAPTQGTSFADLFASGLQRVNADVEHADAMVRAFAVDDSIPLHQVTYALEQARLSVELMMNVRSRLLEGYQELMRMQL